MSFAAFLVSIATPEIFNLHVIASASATTTHRSDSAFGALYTNDNKAELMIVVTAVICKRAQKYTQMQHPLVGTSELHDRCCRTAACCMPPRRCRGIKDAWNRRARVAG